ncbi:hypothetical protein [Methylobacter sp.]|uniref:hypothetical protein n=1 Tax=Methylobacter sp. TaxID=2051955 RepID=UPI003DA3B752
MKPSRIFPFLERIFNCTTRVQLPEKSSQYLILEGYIKEVPHEETWSMGKFTCIFHELTEKGKTFYEDYINKNKTTK